MLHDTYMRLVQIDLISHWKETLSNNYLDLTDKTTSFVELFTKIFFSFLFIYFLFCCSQITFLFKYQHDNMPTLWEKIIRVTQFFFLFFQLCQHYLIFTLSSSQVESINERKKSKIRRKLKIILMNEGNKGKKKN